MRKLTCKNGNIVYVGTQEEVRTIHHAMYRAWLKDKIQITPTGYFTYERIRIEGFNLIQGILLDKREGYFDPISFDEFVNVMLDVLLSEGGVIRINGEVKSRELVQSQLVKLEYADVEYVLMQFKQQKERIKKKSQYILSMLYQSRLERNAHYTNWVQSNE